MARNDGIDRTVASNINLTACMIRRVEVFRDYKLNVEFNFDLNQFLHGLDISA